MKAVAPSSMMMSAVFSNDSGTAASRSTPNGFFVSWRTRRICVRISSVLRPAMPKVPKPPASDTAAQTSA
jgi:hypothetical protein